MCDPVSIGIATATVGAGSAFLGFQGAKQQAKGERRAANLNYAQDYNALQARGLEVDAQQSELAVQSMIDRLSAQGEISAAAGSLGLAGPTVDALSNASGNAIGREASIDQLNADNQRRQIARDEQGARLSRDSKVAAAKGPSTASLVLGLAKAGLSGANAYTSAGGKF